MALTQGIPIPDGNRPDLRQPDQLRPISWQWNVAPHATGSILLKCGHTQLICCAMIQEDVPRWMKDQHVDGGWLTAEYSMLPYSTEERKQRDITKGKIDGRSQEIQRLIGRSLRAAIDLARIGPRTVWIDCDVLSADGGTRTTAITGAWLALKAAIHTLQSQGKLKESPLSNQIAATSTGIWQGKTILDLCYLEDKDAEVDMNLVMTHTGHFVELQASGEEATYSPEQLQQMLDLGKRGIQQLFEIQNQAWKQWLSGG